MPDEQQQPNDDKKVERRLNRQFRRIEQSIPKFLGDWLHFLRQPAARLVRIPLGLIFVVGGIFSFLPVLGIWMLPLGLLLLAIDVHLLRRPITALVTRLTNFLRQRGRKREQDNKESEQD